MRINAERTQARRCAVARYWKLIHAKTIPGRRSPALNRLPGGYFFHHRFLDASLIQQLLRPVIARRYQAHDPMFIKEPDITMDRIAVVANNPSLHDVDYLRDAILKT